MFKQKRLINEFVYVPINDRHKGKLDPFPPMPPRKGGDRKALLWVSSGDYEDHMITNIYFINSSDETLSEVIYSSSGMQTIDDDVISSVSNEYSYKNVVPGEAVKIDEYHAIFDSDSLVAYYVTVVSDKLGRVDYSTLPNKECIGEVALLWDDDEIA